MDNSEILQFVTKLEWLGWLEAFYNKSSGIWLKLAKKGSGKLSVTYDEALEAALCYGWIDAKKMSYDNTSWLQRFTPRKPDSGWSMINRDKALRLIETGEMKPPGYAAIESAKLNGQWDKAYSPQSKIEVPQDLIDGLKEHPLAIAYFESLDSRNRYAILHRLQTAKTEKTRTARLENFIKMLIEGKKIY